MTTEQKMIKLYLSFMPDNISEADQVALDLHHWFGHPYLRHPKLKGQPLNTPLASLKVYEEMDF